MRTLLLLLTLGVIFVNGWTDAPNAIATCVVSRSLSPHIAVAMSAVCNFLGVMVMTLLNTSVTFTIRNIANFAGDPHTSTVALCAALLAIILWAVAAWCFGFPTSESHALIAGLSGAAIALQGGFHGINPHEWAKVLQGLLLSTLPALLVGFGLTRLIEHLCRRADRYRSTRTFQKAQVIGGAAMSFMHGAQDGQKFLGVLLLSFSVNSTSAPPWWMMLLCSLTISLGTSFGGYRIIKTMGQDMVKLSAHQGFCADLAAALCLLGCSLGGIPVSTTHAKACAILGAGASRRLSAIRLTVVRDMVLTWVLTFPGCGLIGFAVAKLLFLLI